MSKETIKSKKPITPPSENTEAVEIEENEKGDHNLFLLGILSVGIAVTTTLVSLVIYHNSGDVYIDRSRPGFLPDKEETAENTNPGATYRFPDSGAITEEALDEYLTNLDELVEALDDLESPFASEPLSDKSLGIEDKKEK